MYSTHKCTVHVRFHYIHKVNAKVFNLKELKVSVQCARKNLSEIPSLYFMLFCKRDPGEKYV